MFELTSFFTPLSSKVGQKTVSTAILSLAILGVTVVDRIAPAKAVTIRWASEVDSVVNVPSPDAILGAPDGQATGFNFDDSSARLFGFGSGDNVNYDSTALAGLLGVSENALEKADAISFEFNGLLNVPYESSTWIFDDGNASVTVSHDFFNPDTSGPIIAVGNVSRQAYASFFNSSVPSDVDIPFLLFDIDDSVNLSAPDFSVTLSSAGIALGTPDPDALGVISSVSSIPEPSSVLSLLALGAIAASRVIFKSRLGRDK